MERSIELAVEAEDTSKIVHYLRNYAQMQAYSFDEPSGAIATIRRMEQYVIDGAVAYGRSGESGSVLERRAA